MSPAVSLNFIPKERQSLVKHLSPIGWENILARLLKSGGERRVERLRNTTRVVPGHTVSSI
jgi:hypothetical protein